jgi:hypothetical protein
MLILYCTRQLHVTMATVHIQHRPVTLMLVLMTGFVILVGGQNSSDSIGIWIVQYK